MLHSSSSIDKTKRPESIIIVSMWFSYTSANTKKAKIPKLDIFLQEGTYFAKSFKLAVSISFLIVTREKKNTWLLCLRCICSTSWKAFSSQSSASRTFARSTSVSQLLALKSRPQAIFQYNILLCCFFTFNQNGLSKNSISTRIG